VQPKAAGWASKELFVASHFVMADTTPYLSHGFQEKRLPRTYGRFFQPGAEFTSGDPAFSKFASLPESTQQLCASNHAHARQDQHHQMLSGEIM